MGLDQDLHVTRLGTRPRPAQYLTRTCPGLDCDLPGTLLGLDRELSRTRPEVVSGRSWSSPGKVGKSQSSLEQVPASQASPGRVLGRSRVGLEQILDKSPACLGQVPNGS
jgi:hypothetical protein